MLEAGPRTYALFLLDQCLQATCGAEYTQDASSGVQDPSYDARTIRVPAQVFSKLSSSQKQYWEIKSKYMDVLLFIRIGSFYELYEDDAQVAHDLLDWKLTVTGVGHCRQVGCPERGLQDAIATLTAAGLPPT